MESDTGSIIWRHIVLGHSWETSSRESRAEFLRALETDTDHSGIWFDGASDDEGDERLVADILGAIRRNSNIIGLCLRGMGAKAPIEWLAGSDGMLSIGRIQELRILHGNTIRASGAAMLSQGLATSTSLKTLCLDYPSRTVLRVLSQALKSETLKLETLDISGVPHDAYVTLTPLLRYCTSLKKLVLGAGTDIILDSGVDEFAEAVEKSLPSLERLVFGFGYSTPQAYSKLMNALATRDLKHISVGASEDHVVLKDPSPMEKMIASNLNLEELHLFNVEMKDMSGVFLALNHDKLKKVTLVNVIKSAQSAHCLSKALARNTTPLEKLEIHCLHDGVYHEPCVRALSVGLRNSETLTSVTLDLQQVYDIDLHSLAFILEGNKQLKNLRVFQNSENKILVDSGLTRIGHSLKSNKILSTLDLYLNADVSDAATKAFLDGIKVNSTLKFVSASFLDAKGKAELEFYVNLNRGPKQALYLPLKLMAHVIVRVDQCRLSNGRSAREALEDDSADDDDPETALDFMHRILAVHDDHGGETHPPSELFFFIRERCDLFQEAAEVAREGQKSKSFWCCGLFCRR